jgi:hypothetical protein
VEALQFLLGQHVNEVDPVAANAASKHLGNVKGLAAKVLAPGAGSGVASVESAIAKAAPVFGTIEAAASAGEAEPAK